MVAKLWEQLGKEEKQVCIFYVTFLAFAMICSSISKQKRLFWPFQMGKLFIEYKWFELSCM